MPVWLFFSSCQSCCCRSRQQRAVSHPQPDIHTSHLTGRYCRGRARLILYLNHHSSQGDTDISWRLVYIAGTHTRTHTRLFAMILSSSSLWPCPHLNISSLGFTSLSVRETAVFQGQILDLLCDCIRHTLSALPITLAPDTDCMHRVLEINDSATKYCINHNVVSLAGDMSCRHFIWCETCQRVSCVKELWVFISLVQNL